MRAVLGSAVVVFGTSGAACTAHRTGSTARNSDAPGPDGPLLGTRQTGDWRDTIYLANAVLTWETG